MHHLRRARRLDDRSRGAAAVEAALVLPVVLLIFFAILEFGLLFKDWLGVVSAVRAGARIASAEPRQSSFAQDAADQVGNASTGIDLSQLQALWVYKAGPDGYPVGGGASFTGCSTCVKFTWDRANRKFVQSGTAGWTASQQNACPNDSNKHDSVGIYMQVAHKSFTNAIFTSIVLKEHVVMSLEPIPSTTMCGPP